MFSLYKSVNPLSSKKIRFFLQKTIDILKICVIVFIEQIKQIGGIFMNIQKFTQKSVEALQDCEKLAYE